MTFWIYEDFSANRSVIHVRACGFCNHGVGKIRGINGGTGAGWTGPIHSPGSALDAAEAMKLRVRVHSCCEPLLEAIGPKNQRVGRFELEPVDEATLGLEQLFHRRMLQSYLSLRNEGGHSFTGFLIAVRRLGGVEFAKRSLRTPADEAWGLGPFRVANLLDLSTEARVCLPEFESLFTDSEVAEAKRRLAA